MIEYINTINFIIAILGIVSLGVSSILFVDMYSSKQFQTVIKKTGVWIAFAIVLVASGMTIVYSEYLGFAPCGLCWLQRVFLFSQVLVLGSALYFNDRFVYRYGIALSSSGLVIALYQHYLQMGGSELVKCPVTANSADCSSRLFFEFGFMTFPLLSASIFALLISIYVYQKRIHSVNSSLSAD